MGRRLDQWLLNLVSTYGSALGLAVMAGPHGQHPFVSPSSLPADTATAPLGTSAAGNYYAGTAKPG